MSFFQALLAESATRILYTVPAQTVIVQEGTAFGSVPLPSTVSVRTVDATDEDLPVSWSSVGYDGNTPGFYVLDGTVLGISNNLGVKAHIEVIVSHLTNEHIYYDFSKLTEADEAVIATLTDQCGNFNATGVNDPQCEILFDNEAAYPGIKVFRDIGLRGFDMGTSGDNGIADQNIINWYFVINSADGQQANGIQIFAGRTADTNVTFSCVLNASGDLVINWGYTANRFTYTVLAYSVNGEAKVLFGQVKMDFTADTVTVYRNRRILSGSFTLSTIVGKNPASYDNTANLYLGVSNQNGTTAGDNVSNTFFHKFAFTTDKTDDQSLEIEKEFVKGMFRGWQTQFRTSAGNYVAKRAAIIDYIFNGNGYPTDDTFDQRASNYAGDLFLVLQANLVNADTANITRFRHDMVDNATNTWSNYSYLIPTTVTKKNILFIEHFGHGSEGGTTHTAMINDILAQGYDVLFVAMPIGSEAIGNTTTASYTNGHEELYAQGLDTGGPYSPLHLFYEATVRSLNHVIANAGTYSITVNSVYAVGLSGGAYSVAWLAAMDTRITRVYIDRGINIIPWKQYPFNPSTINNDYEANPANGFDTNCGPRNFAFHHEHTTMDILLLACEGGRRVLHLSHTEDPTQVQAGYGHFAWYTVMQKKATEMSGDYDIFINTVSNQEAHLYQAAERAAIIADLP